jgi:hypothetical protein
MVRVTIDNSGIFWVRVTIGNFENGSTINDNSREIFRVWVNFGIFKVMQNFLENGLRSRIMAKKPHLTDNTKEKRVEIAEENVEFANRIWERSIFLDEFSFETGPKRQFRVRRTVGTREDPENILTIQNSG